MPLNQNKKFLLATDGYDCRALYMMENHPDWKIGSRNWYQYMGLLDAEAHKNYDPDEDPNLDKPTDKYGYYDDYDFKLPGDTNTLRPISKAYLAIQQRYFLISSKTHYIDPQDMLSWPLNNWIYPDPLLVPDNIYWSNKMLPFEPMMMYTSGHYYQKDTLDTSYDFTFTQADALQYISFIEGLFTDYTTFSAECSHFNRHYDYPHAHLDITRQFIYNYPIEESTNWGIGDVFVELLSRLKQEIHKSGSSKGPDYAARKVNDAKSNVDLRTFTLNGLKGA